MVVPGAVVMSSTFQMQQWWLWWLRSVRRWWWHCVVAVVVILKQWWFAAFVRQWRCYCRALQWTEARTSCVALCIWCVVHGGVMMVVRRCR
ncbi:hypothetical protein DEO72_LG4g938 [Vigna unguiculata]|uniref:Uncharacterized protein n=1 Tax=Vigna unguiculata TaxID=3917 RepID=A0A4D6LP68_VIGUN|nr:hypothetical protein DEO72_LG4g938 [Vigna unguiculata]